MPPSWDDLRPCPDCHGRGMTVKKRTCGGCHGTGIVRSEPKPEPKPEPQVPSDGHDRSLGSRQRAVLAVLSDLDWHPGWALTAPDVGGSEGLRRLRELRGMGAPIDMRKAEATGITTRYYRLTRRWP